MRRTHNGSRYGVKDALGFRTLRQIREAEKKKKAKMSLAEHKKLIEEARKSKP